MHIKIYIILDIFIPIETNLFFYFITHSQYKPLCNNLYIQYY